MANVEDRFWFQLEMREKCFGDPSREVFEAARFRFPDLLRELLQQMNASERASALETVYPSITVSGFQSYEDTPLGVAVQMGNMECVRVLLSYMANVDSRGGRCYSGDNYLTSDVKYLIRPTPLFVAAQHGQVSVMSCLVEHGADVDLTISTLGSGSMTFDLCTPLMIAVKRKHENAVTFLVKHGANLDLQDENGNTALHHAIKGGFYAVVRKLFDFGASQLYNKEQLTPLLLASDRCDSFMVEELMNRPECTKEQSIDALELLGASIACKEFRKYDGCSRAFEYMMRGMRERFEDHLNPLCKHVMEPVEAYQYRKESDTIDELAQIEGDNEAIYLEGLIIRERILGTESKVLLKPIGELASYYKRSRNFHACIALYRHAIKIEQNCKESIHYIYFKRLMDVLDDMAENNLPPAQKVVLDVLQEAILEYKKLTEKVEISTREAGSFFERYYYTRELEYLNEAIYRFCDLLDLFSKAELCEEDKASDLSVLRKLYHINPRDSVGDTLAHADFDRPPYPKTLKLLLETGFDVNVTNSVGDTPLHKVASLDPSADPSFDASILMETLEVLLDGGAHHDFVNNKGETAIDVAKTDEARRILSERKKLELKCISARAVKKFGLSYLGVVPKQLEKFISMH